jgi:hypothetical protein
MEKKDHDHVTFTKTKELLYNIVKIKLLSWRRGRDVKNFDTTFPLPLL